jgi:hypothetical protein
MEAERGNPRDERWNADRLQPRAVGERAILDQANFRIESERNLGNPVAIDETVPAKSFNGIRNFDLRAIPEIPNNLSTLEVHHKITDHSIESVPALDLDFQMVRGAKT